MLLAETARSAVGRHGEFYPLAAASAARLRASWHLNFTIRDMAAASRRQLEKRSTLRHVASRVLAGSVRSWTGRSAMSYATDSHLPHLVTAGTRMTRVSAMRAVATRVLRRSDERAPAGTGAATSQRRGFSGQPPVSG